MIKSEQIMDFIFTEQNVQDEDQLNLILILVSLKGNELYLLRLVFIGTSLTALDTKVVIGSGKECTSPLKTIFKEHM